MGKKYKICAGFMLALCAGFITCTMLGLFKYYEEIDGLRFVFNQYITLALIIISALMCIFAIVIKSFQRPTFGRLHSVN